MVSMAIALSLWRFWLSFTGGLSIFFLTSVATAPAEGGRLPDPAADYSHAENWLCRPGRIDACAQDQAATIVDASGRLQRERWSRSNAAPVDCFYVYPTISNDPGGNSDLTPGPEERQIADQQLARFGDRCRTFAPVYRQVTMTALQGMLAGRLLPVEPDLGYRDVLAAWRYYLAHDNQGRGFVLIGHSQGTSLLSRLIREEIDGKPIQRRLVSALLVGFNVLVPQGKEVGGEFRTIPLCSRSGQTGCVIAYESFRAAAPPPASSRFAFTDAPGMRVACVDPAKLSGDAGKLRPYFPVHTGIFPTMAAWQPGAGVAAIQTRFVTVPGLVKARCVSGTHGSYLAISVAADPSDRRADDIPGDIVVGGAPLLDWGLHPADINLAMGNLVTIVGLQAQAYQAQAATGINSAVATRLTGYRIPRPGVSAPCCATPSARRYADHLPPPDRARSPSSRADPRHRPQA